MKAARAAVIALAVIMTASRAFAWRIPLSDKGVPFWRPTAAHQRPSPGDPPMPLEVNYDFRLAPTGAGGVLNKAMKTWNEVEGATIVFQDAGNALCGSTGSLCVFDGYNSVTWIASPNNWPYANYVLASTSRINYDSDTGEVTETDMVINGAYFDWSLEGFPTTAEIDLLSVLVHELGHMCMLDDLRDDPRYVYSTMYGIIEPGSVHAASLHDDDIDGLRFLYPESAEDIPAPRVTDFKAPGDTQFRDKIIGDSGDAATSVVVTGYGFIETDGINNLEVEVYRNDAPVSAPAAAVTSFTDYSRFTIDLDLSSASSTGSYDLMVINPDNKADMAFGAIQVNDPGNRAPYVSLQSTSGAVALRKKTVCAQGGDEDGDPVTYSWELTVKPERSLAGPDSTSGECTSFTPDVPGYYLLEVTPSDGTVSGYSAASLITVNRFPDLDAGDGLSGGWSGGCAVAGAFRGDRLPGTDVILVLLLPFLVMLGSRFYRRGR